MEMGKKVFKRIRKERGRTNRKREKEERSNE
jgi:hypothetical protein